MKKSVSVLMLVVMLIAVFCSCSKDADAKNQTTEPQAAASQTQYYDSKGNAYSSSLDVLFYDKDGNAYKLVTTDDLLPDYVNQSTGERLNGFQCYVTEQGFLYYDENSELSLKDGSVSIYYDKNQNVYYDISTVTWDKDGNLHHKN